MPLTPEQAAMLRELPMKCLEWQRHRIKEALALRKEGLADYEKWNGGQHVGFPLLVLTPAGRAALDEYDKVSRAKQQSTKAQKEGEET